MAMLERTNDVGHTLASSYRSGLQTSVSKPSFSTQEIEQAKASHDLVSLIGARVKLTREGQESLASPQPLADRAMPFNQASDQTTISRV